NKDGQLDALELMRWVGEGPDVDLVLEMGTSAGRKGAPEPIVPAAAKQLLKLMQTSPSSVSFSLGRERVQVVRSGAYVAPAFANYRFFILNQFQSADTGKKGFVTLAQLNTPQFQYLRGLHALADRDGDGKLTMKELNAWLDVAAAGMGSQTQVF